MKNWNPEWIVVHPLHRLGEAPYNVGSGGLASQVLANHNAADLASPELLEEREVKLPQLHIRRGSPGEFRFGDNRNGEWKVLRRKEEVHLGEPVTLRIIELQPHSVRRGSEGGRLREGLFVSDSSGFGSSGASLWDAVRSAS